VPAAARQVVPAAYVWQAPAPSQTPVVPQLCAPVSVHWLFGSFPAATGPHEPSAPEPFLAAVHAMHVPVQAALQQTPSAQKPLRHWLAAVQATPLAAFGVQTPLAQYSVLAHCASSAQAVQVLAEQKPLVHSLARLQCLLFAHGPHEPPQSTSVSLPFFTLSVHVGALHVLAVASHTLSRQSAPTRHFLPSAQPPHEPPQSTSVSFPFFT
jgi:hypothetical protein